MIERPGRAYDAATNGVAIFDRSDRARVVVSGRAPEQMLNGLLAGTIPTAPAVVSQDVLGGRGTYQVVLTPKGKMITDLWCVRRGDEEGAGFLLDVPARGRDGLLAHLAKFLPPRLARLEDVSVSTGSMAVVGPEAAAFLSRVALGLRVDAAELSALPEGEWRLAGASVPTGILVMRSMDVWPEAFVVTGPAASVDALRRALASAGADAGDADAWTTLRVEAGRPEYGIDMDEGTIPVEAGVHERAIDYAKGCYTGQEVIVRIRDRGHVNRSLRLLMLGDAPPPAPGTELFAGAGDKPAGTVTSSVLSPRYRQTVALAYVRRGVEGELAPRP